MFPCRGLFLGSLWWSKTQVGKGGGWRSADPRPRPWPRPQPRQRCRGLEHTLAAEWFHLRISVITFRSVIYSWPSAAPHDPPLPQPFDQRKRQWLRKQALSVDSNGFTACFFSLVSPESCADTHRNPVSSYRTYFFSPGTNLRAGSWLWGEPEGGEGREAWGAQEASGKGRGVEVGVARGPFLHCLLTRLSRAALNIMGKAR